MTTAAPCIADAALAFGGDVLDCESRLLSAGWRDVASLHDAAVEHGLSGDSFTDPTHAAIFAALLGCAAENAEPTLELVRALAERNGAHFPDAGYPSDLEVLRWIECCSAGVRNYARLVAQNSQRTAEARECLHRVLELLNVNTLIQAQVILDRHADQRAARRIEIPVGIRRRARHWRAA